MKCILVFNDSSVERRLDIVKATGRWPDCAGMMRPTEGRRAMFIAWRTAKSIFLAAVVRANLVHT